MVPILSGRAENIPYSLSRWTDVPAAKWGWLREQLQQGWMVAFDQRTSLPDRWSMKPEETLGLIFWTKDPTNLIKDAKLLNGHRVKVHLTMTGWQEVEKGAPTIIDGLDLLKQTVDTFMAWNVTWRFSPVPLLPAEVLYDRFDKIAEGASAAGIERVLLSFLQPNDLMPETRSKEERIEVLSRLGEIGAFHNVRVELCNEDRLLEDRQLAWVQSGVCAPPEDFEIDGRDRAPSEGCGCVMAVDPFTINESCTFGCQYCLGPDTPILYSDMVWRPVGNAQIGDRIIGFDEFPTGVGLGARKLREAVVEAVVRSKKPTIRMITEESEVLTTSEHGWLNSRGQWRSTRGLWHKGQTRSHLKQIGLVKEPLISDDYRIGYLAGMTLGDGTLRYQPGQRSDKLGFPQAYWRVALKDEEPLGRLVAYLATLGVAANIRPFDPGPNSATLMQKVEVRALGSLALISNLASQERDTQEFRRGFLAGFYDAEGSCEPRSNLRMSQKDPDVLKRVIRYGAKLGFNFELEGHSTANPTCRLTGYLRDRLRFIATVQPALARKSPEWKGAALVASNDPLQAKEKGTIQEVIDIQTSTSTFFAGGLASHNCYAADKSLSPKKRNTTRGLPIVQG